MQGLQFLVGETFWDVSLTSLPWKVMCPEQATLVNFDVFQITLPKPTSASVPTYQCLPRTKTPSSTHPSTHSLTFFLFQPSLTGMVSIACLPSKNLTHLSQADWDSAPWVRRIVLDMAERWREGVSDARRGFGIRVGD